jgi:hypothetical protein
MKERVDRFQPTLLALTTLDDTPQPTIETDAQKQKLQQELDETHKMVASMCGNIAVLSTDMLCLITQYLLASNSNDDACVECFQEMQHRRFSEVNIPVLVDFMSAIAGKRFVLDYRNMPHYELSVLPSPLPDDIDTNIIVSMIVLCFIAHSIKGKETLDTTSESLHHMRQLLGNLVNDFIEPGSGFSPEAIFTPEAFLNPFRVMELCFKTIKAVKASLATAQVCDPSTQTDNSTPPLSAPHSARFFVEEAMRSVVDSVVVNHESCSR